MIKFTKMQGTGNDYIFINDIKESISNPEKLAPIICNRHYGIGSDGLILILKSHNADFKMRIFNPDGSEAEMCGNGIRCFAKYVYDHKLTTKHELSIETIAGIKKLTLHLKNNLVDEVTVDMGEPILERELIPMLGESGQVVNELLPLDDGMKFVITAVSIGNPHVVIFVEDIENFPIEKYGPLIENHDFFPKKTNVEFIQIINENEITQRTWERGTGETFSCGTGASAATVACILSEKTKRKIKIKLKGGNLTTHWDKTNNHLFLIGPAVEVFSGNWPN